jgi:hypothetical protein
MEESPPEDVPKKIGRPKKSALLKNTPGKMAKRGRPPGEAAALADFKARILTSPKSRKVIEAIFDAALDNDHKNQAAAWKLLMDRMVPVSAFEQTAGGGKPAVTINITGIGGNTVISAEGSEPEGDILDAEYEEE